MRRITYDHERVSFNLARYEKFGKSFELVIEPDLAIDYKKGKEVDIDEVVRAQDVFSDAKKGVFAKEEDLREVFKTLDFNSIANTIIKQGEIQLTAEHREKLRADKRKKIVDIIHKTTINPKSNTPHPTSRIENALNEAKVKISEFERAEDQVSRAIDALKPIIPIKKDDTLMIIELPMNFASSLRGFILNYGTLKSEDWHASGMTCQILVPSGIVPELMDELNSRTSGQVNINLQR